MLTVALATLAFLFCASLVYAFAVHDHPPEIGFLGDFASGFILLSAACFGAEFFVYGLVRFVKLCWTGQ